MGQNVTKTNNVLVLTFDKYGVLKKKDGVIKLIEFNDSVIADLKIVVYDSRNEGSQYKVVESD